MDLFKIFSIKELIDLRKKTNTLETNKVNRAGDTITGALTVDGENRTGTKFVVKDATNGDIRFEKSNTGLLIKQTGVISLLEYTAAGVTTWGDWTFNGLQNFMKRITAEDGVTVSNPNWTGTSNVEILMNASDTSDNYGITLKSGGRKSDGKGVKLTIDPVKDGMRFYDTVGNHYDVLHKGNAQPPAWEDKNNVEHFRAETNSTTALKTDSTWGTFPFNTTRYDNKTGFNTTTNRYIIQEAGLFQFNVGVKFIDHTQGTEHIVRILQRDSAGTITYAVWVIEHEVYYFGDYVINGTCLLKVNAGDQIEVQYWLNSGASGSYGTSYQTTFFEGVRLN